MTLEDLPLDERIAVLLERSGGPPSGTEFAELNGDLACALLDRYEQTGDAADLDRAIELLETIVAGWYRHEDALFWRFRLALARAERGADDDPDRVVDLLEAALPEIPDDIRERDIAALTLIDAYLDRYGQRRRVRPQEAARDAESAIAAVAPTVTEPRMAAYARICHGLILLARADDADDPAAGDAGVALLAEVLATAEPDIPRYVWASTDLGVAYARRDDLDAGIAVAQRAADTRDPDDPYGPDLDSFLASAYQARWDDDADPGDLDQAIATWARVVAADPDDNEPMFLYGRALRERGERNESRADIEAAIACLERAPDDEDRWDELARAYHQHGTLAESETSLRRAVVAFGEAIARATDPADFVLLLHFNRLSAAWQLCHLVQTRDPAAIASSTAVLIDVVTGARLAWTRSETTGSHDLRAMLATLLAFGEMQAGSVDPAALDIDRVHELAEFGATVTEPDEGWQDVIDLVWTLVKYAVEAHRPDHRGGDAGLAEMVRVLRMRPESSLPASGMLQKMAPMTLLSRGLRSGDQRAIRAAVRSLSADDDPEASLMGRILGVVSRAGHGSPEAEEDARRIMAEMEGRPASVSLQHLHAMVGVITTVSAATDGRRVDFDRTPIEYQPGLGGVFQIARAGFATLPAMTAAIVRHDVPMLRDCALRFAELARHSPMGSVGWRVNAGFAGRAELEVARRDLTDREAARRSAYWWDEATRATGTAGQLISAQTLMGQAEALRRAGDPGGVDQSRALGRSALAAHRWQVLQHSGTDDALISAANAARDAVRVAGWCREDEAVEDLIAALDAGRGLTLQAVATTRQLADQLTEAGHPDLAGRWRESAGLGHDALTGAPLSAGTTLAETPDDLRAEVLRALGTDSPLFRPVPTGEIAAALRSAERDALVYLVAATVEQPGFAVVVPAAGAPRILVLPDLSTGPLSVVVRRAATRPGDRDAGPTTPDEAAAASLDDVCHWAWRTAMSAVLDHVGGRYPRLVLVPMGVLSTVPWHAAFRPDATGRRYAVERAVFSYAMSASAFCESAARESRPIRSALIVGDPDGNLPYAGLEARAVHRAFHPGATYLGPEATPDAVLLWVREAAPGPSLLHLACHGRADPARPADARLMLAGGELSARQLLDVSRDAELTIGLAFLAACATGMTGADHDEAFSLSTAFLVAGARTVYGSLWPVPDTATSLLMYLVHHHLVVDGRAPADALHQAQLWMLDPSRTPPSGMPEDLAAHCSGPGLGDPVSWAAFTHMGR